MTDDQTQNQATIAKKSLISPIWFLPIVAALLGLWILFQNITHANTVIKIHFENADSIIVDKTRIRYKGVIVGTVKKIELDTSSGVNIIAEVESHAKFMLREKTQFWLVSPKASLTSITGLDTLFSGSYINLHPGDGDDATNFSAVTEQPITIPDNSLLVNLQSENAGSIRVGTPLFYKNIEVGEVVRVRLDKSDQFVNIKAFINKKYSHLIKQDSKFWNISGLRANVSTAGVDFQLDSLTSLIAGGITFNSPHDSKTLIDNKSFTLYDNIDASNAGITVELSLNNITNLPKGAGIIFKGHGIGRITDISYSPEQQKFIATASINPQFSDMMTDGAQFWLEKTALSFAKIENLGNIITGDFIGFSPAAKSTESRSPQSSFIVRQSKAPIAPVLSLLLLADDASGLSVGNPISYQGLQIGQIAELDFSKNGQFIEAIIEIDHQYQYLINSSSQFYLLSGINVKASLKGVEVQSSPLQNLISGGIGLHNKFPVKKTATPVALNDNIRFRLYPSKSMAKLGKNVFSKPMHISLLSEKLPSVSEGSPVYYQKFPIGEVSGFEIDDSGLMRTKLAIQGQYKHLIQKQSVFWNISGFKVNAGLSGVNIEADSLLAIATGGIAVDIAPKGINTKFKNGAYKLFTSYQAATQPTKKITITFNEGYELQVGTKLRLKGLVVGEINELVLNSNNRVEAIIDIDPAFVNKVTRQGTRFWIIRSDISLAGAKNLSTLVSGVYLNVLPGKGKLATSFKGEGSAPVLANKNVGLPIALLTDNGGSTDIGSPLYYRQIQIGEVIDKQLTEDASGVEITLNVYPQYSHLIRDNSIFWPASGFNLNIGITGASLKSTSLASLIKGGINMSTDDSVGLKPAANAFTRFELKKEFNEKWLTWKLAIPKP
ncbi:paraquat-inducible protein B [Psychromonas marina]|uniref:Paraquat-inducible protein B n=1 Tax=Psychromonas marina TaxID=88364 RepID=A0ABQ6E1U5_9GAMM|nr:MlaD family protein [Psychromonas marina]GLS91322.1 paraquat-inducible protein B [Psychromonas marina]